MNNNNIILKFAFEEIVNDRQQQQGWYELLLRPHLNSIRIPTLEYLDQLSEQEMLDLDVQVFHSLSDIEKKYEFERLSVNVFPTSLKSPYFRKFILDLVLNQKITPSKYCLEVLEHPSVDFDQNIIQFLNLLRERCMLIALDDFGSGAAHWKLLQEGVIDVIKVANQKIDKKYMFKNNYIQALFKFADTLNLTTILEGVEEQKGFTMGRAMGFKHFQGWMFETPLEEHCVEACIS